MGCASTVPVAAPVAEFNETVRTGRFDKKYVLKHEIGSGAFGQVRLCTNKTTRRDMAVKILKPRCDDETNIKKAERELEVWKQVGSHENVVVLQDSFVESGVYYFVMQRCRCWLSEKFPLKGDASCFINFLGAFQQVFSGLAHCHSRNIVHRDIKSANLLVDYDNIVKIADFGLSLTMPAEGRINGLVGSAPFMSPEMVKGNDYGLETDIWSCGTLIYSLVYDSYAYDSAYGYELSLGERTKHMMKAIATNKPVPSYKPKVGMMYPSSHVRAFIQALLTRNAQTRPKADSCVQMVSEVKEYLQNKQLQVEPASRSSTSNTPKLVNSFNEDTSEASTRCSSYYDGISEVSEASYGAAPTQGIV